MYIFLYDIIYGCFSSENPVAISSLDPSALSYSTIDNNIYCYS